MLGLPEWFIMNKDIVHKRKLILKMINSYVLYYTKTTNIKNSKNEQIGSCG